MSEPVLDLDSLKPGRFYTLRVLAVASGLPVSSIRRAVADGDLVAVRMKRSCNSPIRVRGRVFIAWVDELESEEAVRVLSPIETARIKRELDKQWRGERSP
ncbi:MAG: hypothetical protein KDB68_09655 [Planctomycetes bacterium]|nr:hypothetical protein [Planctomycetota bacterium]